MLNKYALTFKRIWLGYSLKQSYFKRKQMTNLSTTEINKNQLLVSRPDLKIFVSTVEDNLDCMIRESSLFNNMLARSPDTLSMLDAVCTTVSNWIETAYYPDTVTPEYFDAMNRQEAQILYDYLINFGMLKQLISEED